MCRGRRILKSFGLIIELKHVEETFTLCLINEEPHPLIMCNALSSLKAHILSVSSLNTVFEFSRNQIMLNEEKT